MAFGVRIIGIYILKRKRVVGLHLSFGVLRKFY